MVPYRTAGGGFFDYAHQADKRDCDQVGIDTFAVHIANPLVFALSKHTPDSVTVATGRIFLINLAYLAGTSSEAAVVLVTGKPFSWRTRASLFLSWTLFSLMSIRAAFGDD